MSATKRKASQVSSGSGDAADAHLAKRPAFASAAAAAAAASADATSANAATVKEENGIKTEEIEEEEEYKPTSHLDGLKR